MLAAFGWWVPAVIAWCVALAGGLAGWWLKRSSLARIERTVEAVALFVGRLVTHLLLFPVFVLVIVPLGLARRRHDALARRKQPAQSYWKRREKSASALDRTF